MEIFINISNPQIRMRLFLIYRKPSRHALLCFIFFFNFITKKFPLLLTTLEEVVKVAFIIGNSYGKFPS